MSTPKVSVIMPARNAIGTIDAALQSIAAQDYESEVETVIGDGSDDLAMAGYVLKRYPWVRIYHNTEKNTPHGLNRAIKSATGEVIIRCDAQSVLPPNYVREVVGTLERTGAWCVGGMQIPVGQNPFGRAVAMAMSSKLGSGDSRYKVGGAEGPSDTVYLGAWPRWVFDRVGMFNPELIRNQDYEMSWRIREAGGVVWFDPSLKVGYTPRGNIKALARQYFDYGRWKARMLRENPKSLKLRQLAPPVILLGLVASLAGAAATQCALWLIPAGVYFGVMSLGAAQVGIERRDFAATLMPLALTTMHASWASGLLYSLASFLIPHRNK